MTSISLHSEAISRRFAERTASGNAIFLTGVATPTGLPHTVTNGETRNFGGVNAFILLQVMRDHSWLDPRFFTVDQAEQSGWSIAVDAPKVALQYLVSTGADGLPLEMPVLQKFHVVNASYIVGVPAAALAAPAAASNTTPAARLAAVVEHSALGAGLVESQFQRLLALTLLEAQLGKSQRSGVAPDMVSDWAQRMDADPLFFYKAAKAAWFMEASVMAQVTMAVTQQRTGAALARPHSLKTANPRVEALFTQRSAILAVSFEDKDKAAALGAVWYGPLSVWFVPQGVPLELFKPWLAHANNLLPAVSQEVLLDSFREEMAGLGLNTSRNIIADGKWHNVAVTTKKGANTSGTYILHLENGRHGRPSGTVINKHTGETRAWSYDSEPLTPEQRARGRAEWAVKAAQATAEAAIVQDTAAQHAVAIWEAGTPANDHGYVMKKGILAEGWRQVQGSVLLEYPEFKGESGPSIIRERENYLIVPMCNAAGELRAVQAINTDGSVKSFMRGAQKKGTMLVLGAQSFDTLASIVGVASVAYVEGISTGASLREAAGIPVVVCFDAGNLETVVADTAAKLPVDALAVLAVDNDQFHMERALGFLSDKLGINPHAAVGCHSVAVFAGQTSRRQVLLGEAVPDGEWHQSARGKYCMTLSHEDGSDAVRSCHVEIVPEEGGRKVSAVFSNRGAEAGFSAAAYLFEKQVTVKVVMPEFKYLTGRPTDWNDLVKNEGLSAVRAILSAHQICMPAVARSGRDVPVQAALKFVALAR
jgi:phage/plasmid primase-like uncharacterized protein